MKPDHPTLPPAPAAPAAPAEKLGAPWIMHVPVISACHLPMKVVNVTPDIEGGDIMADLEDGFILRLPAPDDELEPGQTRSDSPELNALLSYLADRGYWYCRISGDLGDTYADLPRFEW